MSSDYPPFGSFYPYSTFRPKHPLEDDPNFAVFLQKLTTQTERLVPTREEPSFPMFDNNNDDESSAHPASVEPFTNDVFLISLDNQPVGYKRSYKSAMRAVKKLKLKVQTTYGWDTWFQWVEWKPENEDTQRFVLEYRPYNNLMMYTRRDHEITVNRVKYFE